MASQGIYQKRHRVNVSLSRQLEAFIPTPYRYIILAWGNRMGGRGRKYPQQDDVEVGQDAAREGIPELVGQWKP